MEYIKSYEVLAMDQKIQKELDLIKDTIINTVPTEAIYLFGSYAYGSPNQESDLDIYVVIPDIVQTHPLDVGIAIRKNLRYKKSMAIDLLVGKSSVFNRRKQSLTLENTIAEEGLMIYGY